MVVRQLDSLAALERAADAWDDLWRRSDVASPTARAEVIALYCRQFAGRQPFRALLVEADGQPVAALPWIEFRRYGLRAANLPGNCWTTAGELLIDPTADVRRATALLLDALARHAPPWLWFDGVPAEAPRWSGFAVALAERGDVPLTRRRFLVPRARLSGDWPSYLASRSYNHRRLVRRALSKAQRLGPTELKTYTDLTPEEVEPLLRQCFELEARGWKGKAGGAVLDAPAAWQFFLQQARLLAAWGQLSLAILEHGGQPIAFEYGWLAKGVYGPPKIGYDERSAALSPGQLLRFLLFERFFARGDVEWIDFAGPASEATEKWATEAYPIERLVASNGSLATRVLLGAYRKLGPLARRACLSPASPSTSDSPVADAAGASEPAADELEAVK